MANNLTGDYQAVLQLSVRQLNGILAAMHQRGIDPAASTKFPHEGSLFIDERPIATGIEALRFRKWVAEAVKPLALQAGTPVETTRQTLSGKAAPGLSLMFARAWEDLDRSVFEPAPAGAVRGWAHFQLSSPTVSFPPDAASAVRVHVWVRALFEPAAGAASLPAPIHGEVRAVYTVGAVTLPDGRRVLRVRASQHDSQIEFVSAAPLTAPQAQEIARLVRTVLRRNYSPRDVELDPSFAFAAFKGIGGPSAAVALPLQLTGGPAPAGGLDGVTNHFLGASEFAIAVSKEYVQTFVDAAVETMKAAAATRTASVLGARYRASVAWVSVTWKTGSFEIAGRIDLRTSAWWLPDGHVQFAQPVTVALHAPSQTVSLVPLGDAQVSESWFIPHSRALDAVRQARDSALPGASIALNASFKAAQDKLAQGLHEFDPWGSVRYTAVDVTPDGLIARGTIGTAGRLPPVVHAVPIQNGAAFSAFHSWIPGGRIERFEWTWVEGEVWAAQIESDSREHEYVCPRPAGLGEASRICLRIHGSVTGSSGHVTDVVAGEVCTPSWYPPILTVPPWWIEAVVPLWLPRWPERVLNEQIAGHFNVLGESRPPGSITPNLLVHFAGRGLERPLETLGRALAQGRRAGLSLLLVVVLPRGSFELSGRELEARLGSLGERFAGRLVLTEDLTGGWARTFSASDGESTHLVDALGQFAWSHEGRLDGERLAHALDDHALDAPPARHVPLQLAVAPGTVAPETYLVDAQGNPTALRRLRGRRVLLAFWQSWSAPSLRELQRLQALQGQDGAPSIFAVNGGEERAVLDEVRRRHDLTLAVVEDPGRVIAGLYGIRCWPTTVSINQQGFVDGIQIGLADEPRRERPAAGA